MSPAAQSRPATRVEGDGAPRHSSDVAGGLGVGAQRQVLARKARVAPIGFDPDRLT
tara:strand:+ start:1072 stop:1239 length:168 start_codon:yes stop_codon:yes gene_type:complete